MVDTSRFAGLKKLPDKPALTVLAECNVKLATPLESPRPAPVGAVLAELDAKNAPVDMIMLLAHALPKREAVWWSCLAAREVEGFDTEKVPACLAAAEAWVRKPGDDTRRAAFGALKKARPGDDTSLCALVAVYSEGTFGPDELEESVVPPGMFGNLVFARVMKAWSAAPAAERPVRGPRLIERGLDIARGGSGRLEVAAAKD